MVAHIGILAEVDFQREGLATGQIDRHRLFASSLIQASFLVDRFAIEQHPDIDVALAAGVVLQAQVALELIVLPVQVVGEDRFGVDADPRQVDLLPNPERCPTQGFVTGPGQGAIKEGDQFLGRGL